MHLGDASSSGCQLSFAYALRAWVISFPHERTTTSLERNFPSHFIWNRGRARKSLGCHCSGAKRYIFTIGNPPNLLLFPEISKVSGNVSTKAVFVCTAIWHPIVYSFLSGSGQCGKSDFYNRDVGECVPCSICMQYPKTPYCNTCKYILFLSTVFMLSKM